MVTVAYVAAVAKVTTEATVEVMAEAMVAAAVTKAMLDITTEAVVNVVVAALTIMAGRNGRSKGNGSNSCGEGNSVGDKGSNFVVNGDRDGCSAMVMAMAVVHW